MSVTEATLRAAMRAAIVGAIACAIAGPMLAERFGRRVRIALLVAFALMPGLWLGYAYRPEGLEWANARWKADALHGVLSAAKVVPWVALVAWVVGVRSAGPREATWQMTKLQRSLGMQRVGSIALWVDRNRGLLVGWAVAFLWTFSEAEIAALLQARGWTEWTFRKLVLNWPIEDIGLSLWPVAVVVLATVGAVLWFVRSRRENVDSGGSESAHSVVPGRFVCVLADAAMIGLVIAAIGIPVCRLVPEAVVGASTLWKHPTAVGELLRTLVSATVAASGAWFLAVGLLRARRPFGSAGVAVFAGAGALGSLLVSVVLKVVSYDLVADTLTGQLFVQYLALGLVLMPMAFLLAVAVGRLTNVRSANVDSLLLSHDDAIVRTSAASRLWWIGCAPRVAGWSMLFWIGFWDLQTAVMLCPPGWETSPGRLYNLAHYGQNQTLAAMLLLLSGVAFAVPCSVFLVSRFVLISTRGSMRREIAQPVAHSLDQAV